MTRAVRRQTLADLLRRTAARLPAKPAIRCGDTAWNWREFDAVVSRLAAGLHAEGVAQGDRVAVLARNSHGFAALRFALARLGAVLVPVNFMLNADEVAYILRHAGARLLAVEAAWPPSAATRHRATRASTGCLAAVREAAAARRRALRFDALADRRRRRPSPTSAATTCCRSSTPAAPSRARRARCSPTAR